MNQFCHSIFFKLSIYLLEIDLIVFKINMMKPNKAKAFMNMQNKPRSKSPLKKLGMPIADNKEVISTTATAMGVMLVMYHLLL